MAYREVKPENTHNVKNYHSWFTWHKCEVCDREFRREKGFSYVDNEYYNRRLYICASCGCNSRDFVYVNQYIDYMNYGRKPKTHPLHVPPPIKP